MVSNISLTAVENVVKHVCVYREPYLKVERKMIRVNETIKHEVIVHCKDAPDGVPLWDGSENCKDHRFVV